MKKQYLIVSAVFALISVCFLSYNVLIWGAVFLIAAGISYVKFETK